MGEDMRFCPNCGSIDVRPDTTVSRALGGLGDSSGWECNQCGYSGVVPRGDPEEFDDKDSIEFGENTGYRKGFEGRELGLRKLFLMIFVIVLLIIALPYLV